MEKNLGKDALTVSELNGLIKDVINMGFPMPIWVCGEIQGYDRNRTKNHIFFELVEKDKQSKDIVARIGLVIFAGRRSYIDDILKKSENGFSLKDDIEVKFACRIDFYAPHGAVRLIVESIDPAYTLGKIAQEKQRLIALLKEKGTLDKNKQLELTPVPLHVGLITSDDSAAYNDFLSELKKSGFGFTIYLRNTIMQGSKTERDVCKAIDVLCRNELLDVIVITRGGGSIAELSCFDSQMIAEKIASCRLPVLTGIGHEINLTITDLAAHTYAKTPTAIAQFLVVSVEQFLNRMDELLGQIVDATQSEIDEQKRNLRESAFNLQSLTLRYLKENREQILSFSEIIKHKAVFLMKDCGKVLAQERDRLKKTILARLAHDRNRLTHYQKIVDILSPVNTLKRGFTITRIKGRSILRSTEQIKFNDVLETEVVDGVVYSEVKNCKTQREQTPQLF